MSPNLAVIIIAGGTKFTSSTASSKEVSQKSNSQVTSERWPYCSTRCK